MKAIKVIGAFVLGSIVAGHVQADLEVRNFDITGFKLGMTPEEVEAKALEEDLTKYDEKMMTVRGDIENPFLYEQTWGNGQLGRYTFEYMRPPSEPRLTYIKRDVSRQPSNPADLIQNSLMEKYGEPTGNNEGRSNATYYWYQAEGEENDRCATAKAKTVGAESCSGAQLRVSMSLVDGATGKLARLRDAALADFGIINQNKIDFDEHVADVMLRLEQERLDRAEPPRL